MRSRTVGILAGVLFIAMAAPDLDGPPLLPEEARALVDLGLVTHLPRLTPYVAPERIVRLPGLLAVTCGVALLSAAHARRNSAVAGLVLTALSPGLVTVARTAGALPFSAALACLAAATTITGSPWRRPIAVALAAAAVALMWWPGGERSWLTFALGTWGAVAGPTLPPWRLDIALAAYGSALVLAIVGAWRGPITQAETWTARAISAVSLVAVVLSAGIVGLCSPRPSACAAHGAIVSPFLGLFIVAGCRRLPRRLPRAAFLAVAVGGSLVGIANLHARRDLLDPARLVEWDEAARMLAVLETVDLPGSATRADVVAAPALPPNLRLYAPGAALRSSDVPSAERVLVVTHGIRGGLAIPSAAIETDLERRGYLLRGELLAGEFEAGYEALVERLTGHSLPAAYLRIRRFERPTQVAE